MADQRTVFSKIIDGDLPGELVWSDDVAVALLSIAPITDGHALVVPRDPVVQFTDAPDELLAHLAAVAKAVGRAQQAVWSAPRAAVLVAGFEVPHLHLHVLPAWGEGQLSFAHARHGVDGAELAEHGGRLREGLRRAGHAAHVPG